MLLPYKLEHLQINSYTGQSSLNAILNAHLNNNVKTWFIHRYANLLFEWYDDNSSCVFYDDEFNDNSIINCKLLEIYRIPQDMVAREKIIDFICRSIDKKFYIVLILDRYYIPTSNDFEKNHFCHASVVWGYDAVNKKLFCSDFFNGSTFTSIEVDFDDIEQSYNTNNLTTRAPENYIITAAVKENIECYYNKEALKNSLHKYVEGAKYTHNNVWFGIAVYDAIDELLKNHFFDIRSFHCIYDHKNAMCIRLKYLLELGLIKYDELQDQCNELRKKALVLRNCVIKSSFSKCYQSIPRLRTEYRQLKENDRLFCNSLIDKLL